MDEERVVLIPVAKIVFFVVAGALAWTGNISWWNVFLFALWFVNINWTLHIPRQKKGESGKKVPNGK